jgi:hypothetical protein
MPFMANFTKVVESASPAFESVAREPKTPSLKPNFAGKHFPPQIPVAEKAEQEILKVAGLLYS